MRLIVLALGASASCSALLIGAPVSTAPQRAPAASMMWRGAGLPKGKAPETNKADDKSWGLMELFSGWGATDDTPDAGPKLGGRKRGASDDRFDTSRFDRRGLENKKAEKPTGINPLDPSTW